MRRLRQRPFYDYFYPNLREVDSVSLHLPKIIRWQRVINPFSILAMTILTSFILGLFSSIAMSFCIGLTVFMVYQYFRTRALAKSLYIERRLEKTQHFEFDEVVCHYRVINTSSLTSPVLTISDQLEFTKESHLEVEVPFLVPPKSHKSLTVRKDADSGMGIKRAGPVSLHFTDPFGIFESSVSEDKCIDVEVLPKVENLPEIKLKGSPYSDRYGVYDVQAKGSSVNFVGVREYQHGDSLKNIAWKLSAKRGELFVKEFEKMVNAEISLFMNLRSDLQQGSPGKSTWELTKDVALSLVTQQVSNSNTVRIFTQDYYIDAIRGEQDIYELAQQMVKIDPLKDFHEKGSNYYDHVGAYPSAAGLVEQYISMIRPGCNILFITPFVTNESQSMLKSMKALKEMGCEVYCVLIDSSKFFYDISLRIENRVRYSAPTFSGIERFVDELNLIGVHVVTIDPKIDVADSFLNLKVGL